ncbi:FAD-dependent monooxygenase [Nocardia rhamnosiphila]|uniref:FAD-dependent monooxygenase n=2 Tax=Nocardia rhamnosiphila TaxID=426716 RepID=A0ABV2X0N4_9NOCA
MTPADISRVPRGTAVVIGGSIAGCAAAAALHEHYERVVIVDRDELPTGRQERKGVPHAHQYHALNLAGRRALEELFPGVFEQAIADGVPVMDPTDKMRYCSKFGWFPTQPSAMRSLLLTRVYLESILRDRTRGSSAVQVLERTVVKGLLATDGVVTGVEVADVATGQSRIVDADFVVDASGRASSASDWLAALGYPRPIESVVNAKWGYVTTYVRPGPNWSPDYQALYVGPTLTGDGPLATRGAAAWEQEDGLWVLTAQGCAADYPSANESEFREFLSSFGRPEFQDLLDKAEIVRPLVAWRNTTNLRRDYAGLSSRPERFVILGDATAAFNPVYGQGMAAAAVSARLLRDELRSWFGSSGEDLTGFAERYQKQIDGAVIQGCWNFSVGSDFNVPGVEVDGVPYQAERSQEQEFADRVLALATEDLDVHLKLMEMIQMVRGPEWMGAEDVRAKVLADWDRLGGLSRIDEADSVS